MPPPFEHRPHARERVPDRAAFEVREHVVERVEEFRLGRPAGAVAQLLGPVRFVDEHAARRESGDRAPVHRAPGLRGKVQEDRDDRVVARAAEVEARDVGDRGVERHPFARGERARLRDALVGDVDRAHAKALLREPYRVAALAVREAEHPAAARQPAGGRGEERVRLGAVDELLAGLRVAFVPERLEAFDGVGSGAVGHRGLVERTSVRTGACGSDSRRTPGARRRASGDPRDGARRARSPHRTRRAAPRGCNASPAVRCTPGGRPRRTSP